MTVVLINRTRRMKVFTLGHDTYCKAVGSCSCTVADARSGRHVAASLTLAAGLRSPELPDAVLRVPDIARAVGAGELAVERVVQKPTVALPKPERAFSKRIGRGKAR
jgi:hypothetical protein